MDDFPVVISHVCRCWRCYALDTRGFWTSLKFESTTPAIEKYRTWLERTKDSPFDVKIGWQPFFQATIKHAKSILCLIFPHIHRLRTLSVSNFPYKIRHIIFNRINNAPLPSLEFFSVERGSMPEEKPTLSDRKFRPFHHGLVAKLENVTLKRIPYDYVIHRFKNLKALSITNRNIFGDDSSENAKTVQNILSLLPDLILLYIDGELSSGRGSPTPTLPCASHFSLEKLCISCSQDDMNAIFCTSVLPALRRLGERPGRKFRIELSCLPITAQAQRNPSYPNLLRLELYRRQTKPPTAVDLRNMEFFERALSGFRQLEYLILTHIDWDCNRHLTSLARICPNLTILELVYCTGFTLKELRAVIRSREDPEGMISSSLEAVHVIDVLPSLERLQKEAEEQQLGGDPGFNITISKSPRYWLQRIVVIGVE